MPRNRAPSHAISRTALRIVALRKRLGLSQVAFAERVNIPASSLARIEIGSYRPTVELVETIGEQFGVPANELIGPEPTRTAPEETVVDLVQAIRQLKPEDRASVEAHVRILHDRLPMTVKFLPKPLDDATLKPVATGRKRGR